MSYDKATFGAGCFWGVEFVFRRVPGFVEAQVGYSGGITPNPTYREVCSHITGHAEVCQVTFARRASGAVMSSTAAVLDRSPSCTRRR